MTVLSSTKDDLFNLNLIRSYVDKKLNPRFVERHWLKQQIEDRLALSNCRFLLLTAEPGAGKSAFMAWLADRHPDWCRYFIRRDQRTPLGDIGAHSFLLQSGFQLVATYPNLFNKKQIEISVTQRIGDAEDSKVVGAKIEKLFNSPFYRKAVKIKQDVNRSKGTSVTALRIGECYADNRSLPIENLQYLALIDPAIALSHQDRNQRIVVLVDALDELRYRDAETSLLKWLAGCPELPANLRFILTSRPDDDLLNNFRGSQERWLQEMTIEKEDLNVRKDLSAYANFLVQIPKVKSFLEANNQAADNFVQQAVGKANGNFGYLDAIGRAVDAAIRQNQQDLLKEILRLSELPDTLQDLYAFFLRKIKDAVAKEMVPVEGIEGEVGFVPVWPEVYQPILGILSVAREPLTPTQIQKLGSIQAKFDYVTVALEKLRQFLERLENSYRFYHSTLPEFFTSSKAKDYYSYCYVDAVSQNQHIVNYYRGKANSWAEVNLTQLVEDPYGRRYLTNHLIDANRVEELHTLLALETPDKQNAWYEAKEKIGDAAGFVRDVSLAWGQAEDEYYNQDRGKVAIGRQCRYALITTSLNSLAGNIFPELVATLLKIKIWEPEQGIDYILQYQDSRSQAAGLKAIIEYLPDSLLPEALEVARAIGSKDYRAEALQSLVPYFKKKLPEALEEASSAALEAIRDTGNEYCKAKVLQSLAPHLPNNLLSEAKEAAREIESEYYRAMALQSLVPYFDKNFLSEAKEAAREIEFEYYRAEALQDLAPYLTDNELSEALEEVTTIQDEHFQAVSLQRLAPYLTNQELLNQAKEAARKIESKYHRVMALQSLAPHLTNDELSKALETAREIESEYYRVKALQSLAPHFPQEKLLSEALEVARNINSKYYRVKALQSLAPHLTNHELSEALETAREIESEYVRAEALGGLAPHLNDENLLRKALEIAKDIKNKFLRARALRGLAPHLNDENLLRDVLKASRFIGIGYGGHYDDAFKALITGGNLILNLILLLTTPLGKGFKLLVIRKIVDLYYKRYREFQIDPPENIERELENVKNNMFRPSERAGKLRYLALHLTNEQLSKALELTSIIGDESSRSHALEFLIARLLTFSHPDFPLWQQTLHISGTLIRRNFLRHLFQLTPLILELGDDEAIRETVQALRDVSQWWE